MNFPKTKTITEKNESKAKAATLSDFQIFDLSEDLDESKNLAATKPSKLKELQKTMEMHYRELLNDSYVWK
jgi:arylsulfatase A